MSDGDIVSTSGSAASVRARAAEWLLRLRDCGSWTDADQAGLDEWLAQSTAHEVAYLRLEAAWSKADRLVALQRPLPIPKAMPRSRRWPLAHAAAVIGAMVVFGAVDIAYFSRIPASNNALVVETGIGGHKVMTLADGSQIELNTNTALRVAINSGGRRVWLDKGEAYFQVRHDETRPFIVTADGHRITDIGTKFRVRDETGRLEVALLEGSARLEPIDALGPARAEVLTPGDLAVATPTSIKVVRKPVQQLVNELGWRKGLLVFKYATLGTVANEFNRYNSRKIVLADPSLARLTLVGTFRANDTAGFVELAKEVFNVRIQDRDGAIVLSR